MGKNKPSHGRGQRNRIRPTTATVSSTNGAKVLLQGIQRMSHNNLGTRLLDASDLSTENIALNGQLAEAAVQAVGVQVGAEAGAGEAGGGATAAAGVLQE